MRGKFIVIDGMDHSGKGVQIDMLKKALTGDLYFTREPGGTPLAEEIRTILLRTDGPASNPLADFFLFLAARGSHIEDAVEVQRTQGRHVICDRYDSSTYAFQIHGEERGELEQVFWAMRNVLPERYRPDAYIFFDLPAEVAHERGVKAAGKAQSRFDAKLIEYHRRVQAGFVDFAKKLNSREHPEAALMINADRGVDAIHKDVLVAVQKMLAS